jgi:cell division protease FtsH
MGGRIAEELFIGQITTGASNDIEKATEIARAMVVEYGMSERLGPLSFGQNGFRGADNRMLFPGQRPEMSEQTSRVVDEEVSRIVNEARDRARAILEEKRRLLDQLSGLLMVREVLEGKELNDYVDSKISIPSVEDERERLAGERAEQERKEKEKKAEGVGATPHSAAPATEEIPPPPHLREPTQR